MVFEYINTPQIKQLRVMATSNFWTILAKLAQARVDIVVLQVSAIPIEVDPLEDMLSTYLEKHLFFRPLEDSPPWSMGMRAHRDNGDDEVASNKAMKREKKYIKENLRLYRKEVA